MVNTTRLPPLDPPTLNRPLRLYWLGELLKIRRKQYGLRSRDVAKMIGISFTQYVSYETLRKIPSTETRQQLAHTLHWPYLAEAAVPDDFYNMTDGIKGEADPWIPKHVRPHNAQRCPKSYLIEHYTGGHRA